MTTKVRVLRAGAALAASVLAHPLTALAQPAPARTDAPPPITYHIARGSAEPEFRESDLTLARWALEAWGRRVDPPLEFVAAPADSATIRLHWVHPRDGQYGATRIQRVGDRVVADVFIRADAEGLGTDIAAQAKRDPLFRDAIVYLTCVHEFGHAFGLPHTRAFADIMYSFEYGGDFLDYFMRFRDKLERWDDIRFASPFSAADEEAFRSRYR